MEKAVEFWNLIENKACMSIPPHIKHLFKFEGIDNFPEIKYSLDYKKLRKEKVRSKDYEKLIPENASKLYTIMEKYWLLQKNLLSAELMS